MEWQVIPGGQRGLCQMDGEVARRQESIVVEDLDLASGWKEVHAFERVLGVDINGEVLLIPLI